MRIFNVAAAQAAFCAVPIGMQSKSRKPLPMASRRSSAVGSRRTRLCAGYCRMYVLRGDYAVSGVDAAHGPSGYTGLRVEKPKSKAAYESVDDAVVDAMKLALTRIEDFHRRQPAHSWIHNDAEGTLGQLVRPIQRVGIYVPGGTAPLPSSLLMTAGTCESGRSAVRVGHFPAPTCHRSATCHYAGCCGYCGCSRCLCGGRCSGYRCTGIWDGDDSAGRQDLWTGQPLHDVGKTPGLRNCWDRRPAGTN